MSYDEHYYPMWIDRFGKVHNIFEMERRHVWNALRMLKRSKRSYIYREEMEQRLGEVTLRDWLTFRWQNIKWWFTG